jgi:hypothetical protein
MAAFFGSFGANSLSSRRNFVRNVNGNPNSLRVDKLFFQLIQNPQQTYFNGLLPCPFEESLSKVFYTQWPYCEAPQTSTSGPPYLSFISRSHVAESDEPPPPSRLKIIMPSLILGIIEKASWRTS